MYLKLIYPYKRGERADSDHKFPGWCPQTLHVQVRKNLHRFMPQSHLFPFTKVLPLTPKVGATGGHINIEMDEKQIQVFE